ncbi:kinase-like domain-containing protein [Rhodocollybia butyracea]|uniref:Kinase-like domain-containing protein n=1 Tax=Rhodocollybia butyracea TaxID=206335 RepID=A0A9P5PQF6_9AGAR|nr:kinase-like domain-containing protein [Rhodocollybia butyracea]
MGQPILNLILKKAHCERRIGNSDCRFVGKFVGRKLQVNFVQTLTLHWPPLPPKMVVARFELEPALRARAIAIANPTLIQCDATVAAVECLSVQELADQSEGDDVDVAPNAGITVFLINSDYASYDSGCIVVVRYDFNDTVAQCQENENLKAGLEGGGLPNDFLVEKILPKLDLNTLVQRVTIETQNNGDIALIPDEHTCRLGCPLPEFEFASISAYQSFEERTVDRLFWEAKFLVYLDSPFFIRPTALVIDSYGDFRGYLMPFHPAQSLSKVMERLCDSKAQIILEPKEGAQLLCISPTALGYLKLLNLKNPARSVTPTTDTRGINLEWRLKHTWAIDIVSGVAALHNRNEYCGDIKRSNIVLCTDGHCRLIDSMPVGNGYTISYLAPETADLVGDLETDGKEFLTRARDVFALGLVLWALAEEINEFDRREFFITPRLVWVSRSTPPWYCELIETCLADSPEDRPNTNSLLEALIVHFMDKS